MRSEEEMRLRLRETVEARRALLAEGIAEEKKKAKHDLANFELAEDIAHLTGVIMTLEWVLKSGAGVEYERFK